MRALFLFFFSLSAFANGPNEVQVLEAYGKSPEVVQALDSWKAKGFEVQSTSAVVLDGDWNDEGYDGSYLVSTHLQKGKPPIDVQNATVLAMVYRNAGWIKLVRIVDSGKAARALWSIKQ